MLAKADEYFAGFDNHDIVLEDESCNYIARQTFDEDGLAVTISKMRADGLKLEHLRPWLDDPTAIQMVLNDRLTREQMPDHEGHAMWHLKMAMPMMISNRSIISCFYTGETSDGYQALFHSSAGNEEQTEGHAEQIGSDVIAINHLTFTCYKADETGMDLRQIICIDP